MRTAMRMQFYEIKFYGASRIFDLLFKEGVASIGELLVGGMSPIRPTLRPPIKLVVRPDVPLCIQVDYVAITNSGDPDWVMRRYARETGLPPLKKIAEVTKEEQISDVVTFLLQKLLKASHVVN